MRGRWALSLMVVFLGLSLLAPGNAPEAQKEPKKLVLLYSNNINGELDPCPT